MICNLYYKLKKSVPISQRRINLIINQIARILKIKNNWEITILVVGDKQIKLLNKKFRHKDKVTDVLSFSQKEGLPLVLPLGQSQYLGDIVISWPQVVRQAKANDKKAIHEFVYLIIHGFLHLLGYKDERQKDYQKMLKVQEEIIAKIYD